MDNKREMYILNKSQIEEIDKKLRSLNDVRNLLKPEDPEVQKINDLYSGLWDTRKKLNNENCLLETVIHIEEDLHYKVFKIAIYEAFDGEFYIAQVVTDKGKMKTIVKAYDDDEFNTVNFMVFAN